MEMDSPFSMSLVACAIFFVLGGVLGMSFTRAEMEVRAVRAGVAEYTPTNKVFQFKTNHLTSVANPIN